MFLGKPELGAKIPDSDESRIDDSIHNARHERDQDRKIYYWASAFYEWKCLQDKQGLFSDKDDEGKFIRFCTIHSPDKKIEEDIFELFQKKKNIAELTRNENSPKAA